MSSHTNALSLSLSLRKVLFGYVACTILFGSASTILLKEVDDIMVRSDTYYNTHNNATSEKPHTPNSKYRILDASGETFSWMLGQSFCYVVFLIMYYWKSRRTDGYVVVVGVDTADFGEMRKVFAPFVFLPLAMLELTSAFAAVSALQCVSMAEYQMARGLVIVVVVSLWWAWKGRPHWHAFVGVALMVVGFAVPGVMAMAEDTTVDGAHGAMWLLLSITTQGARIVAEYSISRKYEVPAMQCVGWQGIWGLLLLLVVVFPGVGYDDALGHPMNHIYTHGNGLGIALLFFFIVSTTCTSGASAYLNKQDTPMFVASLEALRAFAVLIASSGMMWPGVTTFVLDVLCWIIAALGGVICAGTLRSVEKMFSGLWAVDGFLVDKHVLVIIPDHGSVTRFTPQSSRSDLA
eukprot:PhF_6_TR27308/c0_g1_i1/m.40096